MTVPEYLNPQVPYKKKVKVPKQWGSIIDGYIWVYANSHNKEGLKVKVFTWVLRSVPDPS